MVMVVVGLLDPFLGMGARIIPVIKRLPTDATRGEGMAEYGPTHMVQYRAI